MFTLFYSKKASKLKTLMQVIFCTFICTMLNQNNMLS